MSNPSVPTCQFCHQPTKYCPLEEMERYCIKVYFCHACRTEYLEHFRTNQMVLWTVSIYVELNEKMYRWSNSTGYDKYQLWYVMEPGEVGVSINKKLQILKSFSKEEVCQITPTNIAEKLKSWLLFL